MKIAIMSDIHSNVDAAQKCYDDAIAEGCGRFVLLGDTVGYGPDPHGSIAWVKSHGFSHVLKGNHDAALCGDLKLSWFSPHAKAQLVKQTSMIDDEDRKWLKELPYRSFDVIDGVRIWYAHGNYTYPDPFDYITGSFSAQLDMEHMLGRSQIEFIGHTHYAMHFSARTHDLKANGEFSPELIKMGSVNTDIEGSQVKDVDADKLYIFNVGSVGYPRAQPKSVYCILDTEKMKLTYKTLRFDWASYEKKLEDAKIDVPSWFDFRRDDIEDSNS